MDLSEHLTLSRAIASFQFFIGWPYRKSTSQAGVLSILKKNYNSISSQFKGKVRLKDESYHLCSLKEAVIRASQPSKSTESKKSLRVKIKKWKL
ncbi:unnamed protein product [Blepharisma stoltei]|uniref:Uncharacterized protein n=1 Tax=Blepharisma stoltei TaxID=1481888 RepID=A0AAU9J6K7_9CILI|nr:unnamed protein product [Blepharisma stoltei]